MKLISMSLLIIGFVYALFMANWIFRHEIALRSHSHRTMAPTAFLEWNRNRNFIVFGKIVVMVLLPLASAVLIALALRII